MKVHIKEDSDTTGFPDDFPVGSIIQMQNHGNIYIVGLDDRGVRQYISISSHGLQVCSSVDGDAMLFCGTITLENSR